VSKNGVTFNETIILTRDIADRRFKETGTKLVNISRRVFRGVRFSIFVIFILRTSSDRILSKGGPIFKNTEISNKFYESL